MPLDGLLNSFYSGINCWTKPTGLLAVAGLCTHFVFGVFLIREKVDNDYSALQERLRTLPDKLSYDVMVCSLCSF